MELRVNPSSLAVLANFMRLLTSISSDLNSNYSPGSIFSENPFIFYTSLVTICLEMKKKSNLSLSIKARQHSQYPPILQITPPPTQCHDITEIIDKPTFLAKHGDTMNILWRVVIELFGL